MYSLSGKGEIAFKIGSYDAETPVVIDPVLIYSTYLGGNGAEFGNAIAVDPSGNVYVTGYTQSSNFPGANPLQSSNKGSSDVFIAKLNASGSALLYSTYLGGNNDDTAYSIAVDSEGNAYVTGTTESTNFPKVTPLQSTLSGVTDAFVAKLNSAGSGLIYSTYLGGSSLDGSSGIAVDGSGNAYVAGGTSSTNFPTFNPVQATFGGGTSDGFLSVLNDTGSALLYSTYLGGNSDDGCAGIAIDSSADVYVVGSTSSANFPTAAPFQRFIGGGVDAFVTKLNPEGSALAYSTFLGGNNSDRAYAIALDSIGNAYITGETLSSNFPTVNPMQPRNRGVSDAFVTKLNATGSALLYSTYLGSSGDDAGYGMAVDPDGNAYITGATISSDFPIVNSFQSAFKDGGYDGFVSKLNGAGSALLYSSYLGGSGNDESHAIAVNSTGAYVTGYAQSLDFPTASPFQCTSNRNTDAFIARIAEVGAPGGPPDCPYFSFFNIGATSVTTSGAATSVRTGYALIQPALGSYTPFGVAIFGLRANNTLVSETGVPASAPLTSGRIYAEIIPPVDTGLAIANPNNTAVSIHFSFTDSVGNTIGAGDTTVAANAQIAKFLDEAPFNGPALFNGTFSFQSTQPIGVIALRGLINERNEFLMSALPVVDTSAKPVSGVQLIPHFADGLGWTTQVVLVNPTDTPMAGNLQFYNSDGSPVTITIAGQTGPNFGYSIPARSSQKLTTAGSSPIVTTGSISVAPSAGSAPTPFAIFSYRTSSVTVSEAGVPVIMGTDLRMPAQAAGIPGQPDNIQSGVAVANLTSSPTNVIFSVEGSDGTQIAGPIVMGLSGSGQISKLVGELFPMLPNPFMGVLRVSANSPGVSVVGLRLRYNERGEVLITTTPPVPTYPPIYTPLLFPHIADGGGFTTQFFLFNAIGGPSSSGTLSTYDPNGQPLALGLH